MGNRRGDFRPDNLIAKHRKGRRKYIGMSGANQTFSREHNRRQRQYNRDLIEKEKEDLNELKVDPSSEGYQNIIDQI